jgi:hypothetical protein
MTVKLRAIDGQCLEFSDDLLRFSKLAKVMSEDDDDDELPVHCNMKELRIVSRFVCLCDGKVPSPVKRPIRHHVLPVLVGEKRSDFIADIAKSGQHAVAELAS